jgi:hypothetical protein
VSVLCYTEAKAAGKRGWGVAQNTARKNFGALVPRRTCNFPNLVALLISIQWRTIRVA